MYVFVSCCFYLFGCNLSILKGTNQNLVCLKKRCLVTYPEIADEIATIINNIRNIARSLYPVSLQHIGLKAGIENLCEQMMNMNELFISTEISYKRTLDKNSELQVYRIIQEALNNCVKHANATAVKVTLLEDSIKKRMLLEIKDNGVGFDVVGQLKSKDSFGIHSIIHRSKVIKGETNISADNKGTIINISIPLSL